MLEPGMPWRPLKAVTAALPYLSLVFPCCFPKDERSFLFLAMSRRAYHQVKARLPPDLKPAVMSAKSLTQSETERRELPKQHGRAVLRGDDLSRRTPQTHSAKENRRRANRELVEAYRRDMKRSALGATIASAVNLGPEWRSPEARLVGTAEDNAHRVATLAATQASRMLSGRSEAEEGTLGSFGTEASTSDQRGRHLTLPSGPMGGARERRRAAGEVARLGEEQRMTPQQ